MEQMIKFVPEEAVLSRVSLKPGDVFVLKVDRRLNPEQMRYVREWWESAMGDAKVLILDPCMSIGVLSQASEADGG